MKVLYTATDYSHFEYLIIGWIKTFLNLKKFNGESSNKLWNWLATKSKSKYVSFVENGHYSSDWDDAIRVKTQNRMI